MSNVKTLIAHLAAEHRKRDRDPARIAELRGQIKAQQLENYIRASVDAAPPLTDEQLARIASLLAPAEESAA